jgi:hypothetical protein
LQHEGEVEVAAGDTIPIPQGAKFIEHQCGAGLTTKLWFVPDVP